jgi:hypothetical protein
MKLLIAYLLISVSSVAFACVMPATNASDVAWQLFYQCEASQQQR